MREKTKIGVYGLGRLGLPLALHLGQTYDVTGVDIKEDLIEKLQRKEMPFFEPGCDELLRAGNVKFQTTPVVRKSYMSIIFVGTPNEDDNPYNPKYVRKVGESIGKELRDTEDLHLVVLRSTVFPGETSNLVKILEKQSGKHCNSGFDVCYNPEMLALGTVLKDLENPKLAIIGESRPNSYTGEEVANLFSKTTKSKPEIIRTSFENAELAKVMINNYLTMKMNFANMMGDLAGKIEGANADEMSDILGKDSRIGRQFLTAGTSYGGTCFPRDNWALKHLLIDRGMDDMFAEEMIYMNKHNYMKYAKQLGDVRGKRIAILGAAFKPDTDVIEQSASLKLAEELKFRGAEVVLHDEHALPNVRKTYGDKYKYEESVFKALRGADACVIMHPSKAYKLPDKVFEIQMNTPKIIDAWRIRK